MLHKCCRTFPQITKKWILSCFWTLGWTLSFILLLILTVKNKSNTKLWSVFFFKPETSFRNLNFGAPLAAPFVNIQWWDWLWWSTDNLAQFDWPAVSAVKSRKAAPVNLRKVRKSVRIFTELSFHGPVECSWTCVSGWDYKIDFDAKRYCW